MTKLEIDFMEYSTDALAQAAYVSSFTSTAMTVAYDSGELAAPATSITISGLNGDVDEEYELIVRTVNDYNGSAEIQLLLNADDGGSHYGFQWVDGTNATASALRATNSSVYLATTSTQNYLSFSHSKIMAKSGYVRTAITKTAQSITTTTVTSAALIGQSWNNTADNLTSMVVRASQANGLGIGSRVILLKKSSSATTKTWEEIYNHTVTGSAVTSLTIPSLTGNTDVIYRLKARIVNGYSGGTTFYVRPNNDSGTNYGFQYIDGANTSATAGRNTSQTYLLNIGQGGTLNDVSQGEMLIYAKSGFVRTCINEMVANIAGTTVGEIQLMGQSHNDTTNEYTSLVIAGNQTGGIGIGSSFSLERLNT